MIGKKNLKNIFDSTLVFKDYIFMILFKICLHFSVQFIKENTDNNTRYMPIILANQT